MFSINLSFIKQKKKKRLCDEIIARGVYVGGEGKGEHGLLTSGHFPSYKAKELT